MKMADNLEDFLNGSREIYNKLNYNNIISIPYIIKHNIIDDKNITYEVIHLKCFHNDIEGVINYVREEYIVIKDKYKGHDIFIDHQEFIDSNSTKQTVLFADDSGSPSWREFYVKPIELPYDEPLINPRKGWD